ncbi:MAG: hypothetical protein WAW11_03925 [Patescibacteria group bacterium]
MRITRKNVWEKIFPYPSFSTRFWTSLTVVFIVFSLASYYVVFKVDFLSDLSNKIAVFGIIVQLFTLIFGVFAVYFALRQLIENRFASLDKTGFDEVKNRHYLRAIDKWTEAFYIKPDIAIFTNLCEAFLLVGDYHKFDAYIKMSEEKGLTRKKFIVEACDRIVLLFLRTVRNLLIKNQGEAEVHIGKIIELVKNNGLIGFQWDFLDISTSSTFQDLNGECREIAENLISYLSKNMTPNRLKAFEEGEYASKISD